MKNILVTGGTGFIGSHTCISLIEDGYKLTIIDNNINSSPVSLERVRLITKNKFKNSEIFFERGDIRDRDFLKKVFLQAIKRDSPIEAVIHFAGLKAVGESVFNPLLYWDNNVTGSICLLEIMNSFDCRTIVFSSSATVYGYVKSSPILEDFEIFPENPYGKTKAAVEFILQDIFNSNKKIWKVASLRYFNPIGAHESGLIGEEPNDMPNNLFPIICKVAQQKINKLMIYGKNWPTKDGTGIRDYIHVMDLADSHKSALEYLIKNEPQYICLNIGTGLGTSVSELVRKFIEVNECDIPFEYSERRLGDVPILVANNKEAIKKLNWVPKRTIEDMCKDGWNWYKKNPNGFSN